MSSVQAINSYGIQPNYVNFKGNDLESRNVPPEIDDRNQGMSKTTKVLLGLGALSAAVVGGILYHKSSMLKSAKKEIENITQELINNPELNVLSRGTKAESILRGEAAYTEEQALKSAFEKFTEELTDKKILSLNDRGIVVLRNSEGSSLFKDGDGNILLGLVDKEGKVTAKAYYDVENADEFAKYFGESNVVYHRF